MKFKDIPQFPSPHYSIDAPWTHIESNLEVIAGGGKLNLDPDYQRAHVWTPEQQSSYVEFQLMGGDISRTLIFNAPFWGDMRTRAEDTYIELIDGKQRLEAVRAFFRNDITAFGCHLSDFEDKVPTMHYRFSLHVCSLKTREEVLNLYLNINSGGTPHTKSELKRVRDILKNERNLNGGARIAQKAISETKSKCLGSGSPVTLSASEQMAARTRCPDCGRSLKLRKNESGFAAKVATIPQHNAKSETSS